MSESEDHLNAAAESPPPTQAAPERPHRMIPRWVINDLAVPFLASRAMLLLVGWLALLSFQNLPANPGTWELKPDGAVGVAAPYLSPVSHPVLNMLSRWDGGWYHSVAKEGYKFTPGRQSNSAFFPLYPLLMRVIYAVLPGNTDATWILAGCVVSNVALLIALAYLVQLLRLDFDHETAARAALYLLVFPTTFFFSAVYSESVFLVATVASFYYVRRSRWLLASAFGAAATLTRSPGILLGAPLLLEYLAQREFRWRAIRANVLWLGLLPAALVAHMIYLQHAVGNAMAIQDAQRAWGGEWGALSWPWTPVVRFVHAPWMFNDVMNFSFAAAVLILVVLTARRLRPSYGLYAAICYWFITSWSTFESMPRYVLVIFPAFAVLAKLGRNAVFDRAYLIFSSGLAALFFARFALWRWVA